MQSTILGSILRLDNNSSLATELEFQGENAASMFSLGYKRKVKNFVSIFFIIADIEKNWLRNSCDSIKSFSDNIVINKSMSYRQL